MFAVSIEFGFQYSANFWLACHQDLRDWGDLAKFRNQRQYVITLVARLELSHRVAE